MPISKNNKKNRKGEIYLSHNEWKKRQNLAKLGLSLAKQEYMQNNKDLVVKQPTVSAEPINTDELVHGSDWWANKKSEK